MMSGSGIRVSDGAALQQSAVFACVRIISSQFALLPFLLYKKDARGSKKLVTDHWLYTLMAKRPNQFQNAFEWRRMMQAHMELRGNCYNQIIGNSKGEITALVPIHPDRIKLELLDNGSYRYQVTLQDGSTQPFARGEIWHHRGLSLDGLMGINTIEIARESLGLSISAQSYGARFFANNAKPGGWVEVPGTFADETKKKAFSDSWHSAQGKMNQGKTAVLERGMKYHELTLTNEDAQFLETRKFQTSEIARWFGVPPHKIADLEKATFSNIEQQALEFIQDCLLPRAESWEYSIESELLFDFDNYEVEFDFTNLMRGDSAARSTYYASGIQWGWMTRNEARVSENRERIAGLDAPLRPLNMVEEGDAEDMQADVESAEPPQQEQQEQPSRLGAVLASNAARLARRFAKAGVNKSDAEMIAEGMGITRGEAVAWCATAPKGDEHHLAHSLLTLSHAPAPAQDSATIAIARVAEAIASQPQPVFNIHIPERSINISTPVTLDAKIEANRTVTKTVVSERKPDGTIVSKVTEK